MTNAFQHVLTYTHLERNWRQLFNATRHFPSTPTGAAGKSLHDFARDPKGELRALTSKLKSGAFAFSPLKPHLIPKPNGKNRLICVPTVGDRVIQRTLLEFLSKKYHSHLANNISYGFVKGRTVQGAAAKACTLRASHPWVLKTDIRAFFDQIDRSLLDREMRRLVRENSLHDILHGAITCEIGTANKSQQREIQRLGIKKGLGVRQGMPLSPFMSNVLLVPLDRQIQKRAFAAVRYADDLIFFSDSEQGCKQILDECANALKELKLDVPSLGLDSKTRIYEPREPAEFLGLGLCKMETGYSLRLLDAQREAIRNRILALGSVKELLAQRINLASLGSAVANRISGYVAAYDCCDNITELEHELESLRKKLLRRIYQNDLQIPIAKLSAEARTFLAL